MLRLSLPPRRASARRLRLSLRAFLSSHDVPRATIDEVLLAADEAFINAFMHAGDVDGAVTIQAQVRADRILVEIRDRGCGFDVGPWTSLRYLIHSSRTAGVCSSSTR